MKKFIIYKKPIDTGRPRQGKQIKEHTSIRLEARHKEMIIKKFGKIQVWIDYNIQLLERSNTKVS
jgi:hypothetical protein